MASSSWPSVAFSCVAVILVMAIGVCEPKAAVVNGNNGGSISADGAGRRVVTVEELQQYMDYYQLEYRQRVSKQAEAEWSFQTNITDYNSAIQVNSSLALSAWLKQEWTDNVNDFDLSVLDDGTHAQLKRLFDSIKVLGIPALPDEDLAEWSQLISDMTSIYGSATICPYDNQDCDPLVDPTWALEPDLEEIFLNSYQKGDYDLLAYVWEKWRELSGRAVRDKFIKYAELTNKGAVENGLTDGGALWLRPYESQDFKAQVEKLYDELRPFYQELHAYVRHKLRMHYGEDKIDPIGPIPAHILGNMWAQGWQAIFPVVSEFQAADLDVTAAMQQQKYTVRQMFNTSDQFFLGLGLEGLETAATDFYEISMLEKPTDGREVVCHASAWDFMATDSLPGDFRIKMCTTIDMDDLVTIHHEMGHIQYYMQYVTQPPLFREGANPGFHEAIGDTLALSVATPKHLKTIGLLPENFELNEDAQLAFLLKMALEKVAFLPFGYIMDLYRWKIFDGSITTDKLNEEWWNLRYEYQGLAPPVARSEDDFDPGCKYHVVNDVPYIRYFVAHVLQFMFHQTLCEAAGQFDPNNPDAMPMHECDIGGSDAAGAKLKTLLQAGSSKHWEDILEEMTGSREMHVAPMLNYFKPLRDYLKKYIEDNDLVVGWFDLNQYNSDLEAILNRYMEAEWTSATNITAENSANALQVNAEFSKWEKEQWEKLNKQIQWQTLPGGSEERKQFELISVIGTSALDEEKDKERSQIISDMSRLYSTAKICPFEDQGCSNPSVVLDPDLENTFNTVRDYDKLAYVWTAWRDATGKKVKDMYKRYVELSNEAAKANQHPEIENYADLWLMPYEHKNFTEEIHRLWEEMSQFYLNLHGYVRHRLRMFYADNQEEIKANGPIPAHLLGNMWSQDWSAIYPLITEFENVPELDVTQEMVQQNYTYMKMFDTSDQFFITLGLKGLDEGAPEFYSKSLLVRPDDGREVVCHASAWDMYKQGDFRIKQCTDVNMDDFIVIHHEMGHTQYQMQYSGQPTLFRDGANPGFHEAIGDVMALSVSTPKHLHTLGLIDKYDTSENASLAYLLRTALSKIVFLPFAYTMDAFRWSVFRGEVIPEEWNRKWWELREQYQGIKPPVTRSANDFDHGSKFHSVADVAYIQYFVSYIIQFSIHEALCKETGQYNPDDPASKLHECDISAGDDPTKAGKKLEELMKVGASRPWPEVLEKMTGSSQMSAQAMLDYFKPLNDFLEKRLQELGASTNWDSEIDEFFKESKTKTAQTVPIVVGSIIGGIAALLLVGFLVKRKRMKNKRMAVS